MTEFLTWNDFYPWVFSEDIENMIVAVVKFLLIAVCVMYFAVFVMERYVCCSIATAEEEVMPDVQRDS